MREVRITNKTNESFEYSDIVKTTLQLNFENISEIK